MACVYDLIIAVLRQAARDYVRALLKDDLYHKQDIEAFFLSEYGQALSRNNGEKIIERCQRIAEKKKKKKKERRGDAGNK